MKIVNKIKTLGFGFVFERAFDRIVPAWMCRFCALAVYQVDSGKSADGPCSPAVLKICDSAQELELLKEITRASGDMKDTFGVLATLDDEVAGGVWIAMDDYRDHDLGLSLLLGNEGAWIYSARVDERHRRRGIYSHLLAEAAQARNVAGHAAPYIGVSKLNRGSHKAIQRLGTPVGEALVILLGSMVWVRTRGDLKQNQSFTFQCTRRPIQLSVPERIVPATVDNRGLAAEVAIVI